MSAFDMGAFDMSVDRGALDLVARSTGASLAMGAASGAIVRLDLGGARGALLLVDQRLPVGDRDLNSSPDEFPRRRESRGGLPP